MLKILLLLVYLYDGEVRIDKSYHATHEACQTVAAVTIKMQVLDPKFDEGYFVACLPTKILEAKNESN
jgi:hypothetical protein